MAAVGGQPLCQLSGKPFPAAGSMVPSSPSGWEYQCQSDEVKDWVQGLLDLQAAKILCLGHPEDMKLRHIPSHSHVSAEDAYDPRNCMQIDSDSDSDHELSYNSFDWWCNVHDANIDSWEDRYQFIRLHNLERSDHDPQGYRGREHAVHLIYVGSPIFRELDVQEQQWFEFILNRIRSDQYMGHVFDEGQTVDRRWQVQSRLSDAYGFFNRGVHLVRELYNDRPNTFVMKVLPSRSMYRGYAKREVDILFQLKDHPNIVQYCDSYAPYHRHAAPWLVMYYCNQGILISFVHKVKSLPALFIWHVFESLAEAVRYSHTGPMDGYSALWDPVSHIDIIPGNITFHKEDDRNEVYPTVKLTDWGCAVTQSEVNTKRLIGADLPVQDRNCIPPEGYMGSEAADIYQVGLVVKDLLKHTRREHGDLEFFVAVSTSWESCERPRAAVLLDGLRDRREYLTETGHLTYEPLAM